MERYYSNPFEDDDDQTCFAEIEVMMDESCQREYVTPPRGAVVKHHHDPTHGVAQLARQDSIKASIHMDSPSMPPPAPVVDDGAVKALQQRLNDTHARMRTMKETYEAHIESLRVEMSRLSEESNQSIAEKAELESQVRALSLAKENAEWTSHQEKERNEVLERKVQQLEMELQSRARELSQNHQQLSARSTSNFSASQAPSECIQPSRPVTSAREMPRMAAPRAAPPAKTMMKKVVPAMQTEKEKELLHRQRLAIVENLELQLLQHSQQRDELTSKLQRMESVRARTVADKAKRLATEQDLEREEQAIGHIRLQLRSHASLTK